MPARPTKNGRSIKSRKPIEQDGESVRAASPIGFITPAPAPESAPPEAPPAIPDIPRIASPSIPSIPYLEDDVEEDTPPIPIPVPRSQTPQLVFLDEPAYHQPMQDDHHHALFDAPPHEPQPEPAPAPESVAPRPTINTAVPPPAAPEPDPFSYGYGFSPSSRSPPPIPTNNFNAIPNPNPNPNSAAPTTTSHVPIMPTRSSTSGISRTIRSPSRNPGLDAPGVGRQHVQRFAPTPAVPVVDLATGTAGRGGGGGGSGCGSGVPTAEGNARRSGNGNGNGRGEEVAWARWDEVVEIDDQSKRRRRLPILIISYPSTLRIWDTSDLERISEILRLPLSSILDTTDIDETRLVDARVLPTSPSSYSSKKRGDIGDSPHPHPLLGMAFSNGQFAVYSLNTHRVVHRFVVGRSTSSASAPVRPARDESSEGIARIDRFEASEGFIVVSTTHPSALHVYSSTSYDHLFEIPASKLAVYTIPLSLSGLGVGNTIGNTNVQASVGTAKAMLSNAVKGALGSIAGTPTSTTSGSEHRGGGDNHHNLFINDTHIGNNINIHTNIKDKNHVLLASASTWTSPSPSAHTPLSSQLDPTPTPIPTPVFALSNRLLVYVSSVSSSPSTSSASGSANSASTSPIIPHEQHKLATTAQSVWGGMKALGGLAVSAARSRMGSDLGGSSGGVGGGGGGGSGGAGAGAGAGNGAVGTGGMGKFFSRSAPGGLSGRLDGGGGGDDRNGGVEDTTTTHGGGGAVYIKVIDLSAGGIRGVVEIPVLEKDKPISRVSFGRDGTCIGVVGRDGQGVKVYQIRPVPSPPSHTHPSSSSSFSLPPHPEATTLQAYHLRRGRTGAIVDALEWNGDGRWVGLGTRKGTVHLFGVNPYGGRMDVRSHWEGRVRNVDGFQPAHTDIGPIVRIRAAAVIPTPASSPGGVGVPRSMRPPLAFKFIEESDGTIRVPKHLLPTHLPTPPSPYSHSHSHSYSRSYSSSHHRPTTADHNRRRSIGTAPSTSLTTTHSNTSGSPPHSPSSQGPTKNYQDILLFDPVDVSLSLRRVTLDIVMRSSSSARDLVGGIGMGMGMGGLMDGSAAGLLARAAGVTSISLPGMGYAAAALSSSPSSGGGGGGLFQHQHYLQQGRGRTGDAAGGAASAEMELAARESTVMTWSLGSWQGVDVRKVLGVRLEDGNVQGKGKKGGRADWLAQAELSTCSKSSNILPRSIYLSHQFSFHTLGEDYHALIRRYQLDIGGLKIDVRREVQVSAYSSGIGGGGGGESFIEASPRDIRHHHHHHHHHRNTLSSSFDEPLASALSNSLDHPHTSGVLPMLPNGTGTPSSSSIPQAFIRNAIPIRTIGDGVSEGFGRLRREVIGKVRSPKMRPRPDSGMSMSVPLEFDEEDEDFVGPGFGSGNEDGGSGGAGAGGSKGKGANEEVIVRGREVEGMLEVVLPSRPKSSSRETSGDADSGSAPTASTPATSEDDWDGDSHHHHHHHHAGVTSTMGMEEVEGDAWGGWSAQDKLAVEEAERFDNIDVLGLLDEEQQQQTRVGVRPPPPPSPAAPPPSHPPPPQHQVSGGEETKKRRGRRTKQTL